MVKQNQLFSIRIRKIMEVRETTKYRSSDWVFTLPFILFLLYLLL